MRYFEKMELALSRRLEELRDRLIELTVALPDDRADKAYDDGFYARLTEEDADRMLPEQLPSVQDVLSAIRRAEDRLWDARCERRFARETGTEMIPGQLTMPGFRPAPALRQAS